MSVTGTFLLVSGLMNVAAAVSNSVLSPSPFSFAYFFFGIGYIFLGANL